MAVGLAPTGQRLVLTGVDWATYRQLLHAFDERPGVRLTYDRGALEIKTLTHEHESDNRFLAQLVAVLTDELGLPLKQGGSTTFRRRPKRKGIEPDSCFWIAREHLVRVDENALMRQFRAWVRQHLVSGAQLPTP